MYKVGDGDIIKCRKYHKVFFSKAGVFHFVHVKLSVFEQAQ